MISSSSQPATHTVTQVVVAVATAIAVLDVFFILVAVPESLPAQQQKKDGSKPAPARGLTLEQVSILRLVY